MLAGDTSDRVKPLKQQQHCGGEGGGEKKGEGRRNRGRGREREQQGEGREREEQGEGELRREGRKEGGEMGDIKSRRCSSQNLNLTPNETNLGVVQALL